MLFFKNSAQLKYINGFLPVNIYFIAFSIAAGLMFSCNKPPGNTQVHSDYDKVLDSTGLTYDHGKYKEAVHYLDSVSPLYKDLGLVQKYEYYAINYNYDFRIKKDLQGAMPYADSILNLFDTADKKLKYAVKYGQAFFFKGDVFFAEEKYNDAYQYFYHGRQIANTDTSKCVLGDFSYRMGMIMYKQEHYRLAAANFKNSSEETGSCELNFRSFYRRQELLDNTGLSYSKINEDDSAIMYFNKGLALINEKSKRFNERQEMLDAARAVIYGNEANIYINGNKFQYARQLLKKSIEINLRKGNDSRDAELSELKLIRIYYLTNEADSMINLARIVRGQLDSVKNLEAEKDWNLMMADYFIRKEDHKTALDYFVKYDALKDSITRRDKALKEADIAQQIKRLDKDNEFDTLKKNNRQQDFYLKIGAVFGVMLLIIFLLILLNWQKSRRNIKTLGSLNHQINDQNYSLEHTLAELKLSSQEKDRILRTVAHDLRNPIGGIASLTSAMADDDYTDEQKELLNLIKETSNNSLELINEILEVTGSGSPVVKKDLVEINSLLSHSVELLRFKAAEKNQLIKLDLMNKPNELFISREKIWRVVSNLISNAIKFSPGGATIYVKVTDVDKEIEISVKDPGIGIPEKNKNKVFNMFTEAKRPGTAGEKSFGLGLSISRQIVENHNGKIWFENNTDKGTTFYVRLPKP